MVIEAAFKDINALLASPYGRVHQLSLKTNGSGLLIVQALSGGSTLAQAAQFKPEGEMASLEVPGIEEAQKKKNEMRFEFGITLPNIVTAKNGTAQGKSVAWSVERAKCKDDDEFATKLGGVLEASCSMGGLKFSPITPPRLGLLPFDQLIAAKTATAAALPDTNKIMAAVRFVPYVLNVTRTLDLSGEGSGQASQAQLTGAILLPAELAPQRWGQVKLEEAQDAKGNSLMPKDEAESMMSRVTSYSSVGMSGDAQDEEPDERLMRSIEEKIDIPDSRKDDFRREIMNYIGALAIEGRQFDFRTNERLLYLILDADHAIAASLMPRLMRRRGRTPLQHRPGLCSSSVFAERNLNWTLWKPGLPRPKDVAAYGV